MMSDTLSMDIFKELEDENYKDVNTFKDYGGNDRVTIEKRNMAGKYFYLSMR